MRLSHLQTDAVSSALEMPASPSLGQRGLSLRGWSRFHSSPSSLYLAFYILFRKQKTAASSIETEVKGIYRFLSVCNKDICFFFFAFAHTWGTLLEFYFQLPFESYFPCNVESILIYVLPF
jgi:hypothetical protein